MHRLAGPNAARSMVLSKEALDFAPGLLAIQENPPARMPRAVLYSVTLLFGLTLAWVTFGRLDIVATAQGRLVPATYLKVVQPADGGIVKEILVHEDEHVSAGQVLLRMDAQDARADAAKLRFELEVRSLQLRRIDAELAGRLLRRAADDPPELFRQVEEQYWERHLAYREGLAQAEEQLRKAERDDESGEAVLTKLRETTPLLKEQAQAYAGLGGQGYVPKVTVDDKERAYIEGEQDLEAQKATVQGLSAAVEEANQQVREITSKYRGDLENERVDAEDEYRKLQDDWAKELHRSSLLELKAPQSGIVKDLATHTIGTVVAAGTVLLSIVPEHVPLVAEVIVKNEDIGFIHPNQKVKIKLAAYPFQKYGLLGGEVEQISPDAGEGAGAASASSQPGEDDGATRRETTTGFKALVRLDRQALWTDGESLRLVPGMEVVAEVREGRRSVLQYLLSPLRGALHDSARER